MPPEGIAQPAARSDSASVVAVVDRLGARIEAATNELTRLSVRLDERLHTISEDHRAMRAFMDRSQAQGQNHAERIALLEAELPENAETRLAARTQDRRWFLLVGGAAAITGLLSVLTTAIVIAQFVMGAGS